MIMRYGLFVLHKSSVFPVTCFLRVMAKKRNDFGQSFNSSATKHM